MVCTTILRKTKNYYCINRAAGITGCPVYELHLSKFSCSLFVFLGRFVSQRVGAVMQKSLLLSMYH